MEFNNMSCLKTSATDWKIHHFKTSQVLSKHSCQSCYCEGMQTAQLTKTCVKLFFFSIRCLHRCEFSYTAWVRGKKWRLYKENHILNKLYHLQHAYDNSIWKNEALQLFTFSKAFSLKKHFASWFERESSRKEMLVEKKHKGEREREKRQETDFFLPEILEGKLEPTAKAL